MNSLNLGVPDRIWNRMYKAFGLKSKKTSSQISSDAAFREVDKYLKSTHLPVILVVDEVKSKIANVKFCRLVLQF